MGGAGMFSVSLYTIYMGEYHDKLVKQANGDAVFAGHQILYITSFIPIVLIVAFAGLMLYMKSKNKTKPLEQVAV
jgi:hypothetical protein